MRVFPSFNVLDKDTVSAEDTFPFFNPSEVIISPFFDLFHFFRILFYTLLTSVFACNRPPLLASTITKEIN
jgi:hypothetical protein